MHNYSMRIMTVPMAILPSAVPEFLQCARRIVCGPQPVAAAGPRVPQSRGRVALLNVFGVLESRSSWLTEFFGGTSYEQIGSWIDKAMADASIGSIVMNIDSPGGTVAGLQEVADKVTAASKTKPVYAIANGQAASAAYWLGSSASAFYASPTAEVGSIGVLLAHADYSKALENDGVKVTYVHAGKYKVEGNATQPLDTEAQAEMQRQVDHYYGMFVGHVAKSRGVSKSKVESDFGQGRMIESDRAASLGMIDGVRTLDNVLSSLVGAADGKKTTAMGVMEKMQALREKGLTSPTGKR